MKSPNGQTITPMRCKLVPHRESHQVKDAAVLDRMRQSPFCPNAARRMNWAMRPGPETGMLCVM